MRRYAVNRRQDVVQKPNDLPHADLAELLRQDVSACPYRDSGDASLHFGVEQDMLEELFGYSIPALQFPNRDRASPTILGESEQDAQRAIRLL